MGTELRPIEVYYDGACPLCRREVAFLRRLDRKSRIWWIDIAAPSFEAPEVSAAWFEAHGSGPPWSVAPGSDAPGSDAPGSDAPGSDAPGSDALASDAPAIARMRDALMAQIHARLPDGRWVTGVEVFRRIYTVLGLGWLIGPTRWPGVRQVLDSSYRWFARHRLHLTGRCSERCVAPDARARATDRSTD